MDEIILRTSDWSCPTEWRSIVFLLHQKLKEIDRDVGYARIGKSPLGRLQVIVAPSDPLLYRDLMDPLIQEAILEADKVPLGDSA